MKFVTPNLSPRRRTFRFREIKLAATLALALLTSCQTQPQALAPPATKPASPVAAVVATQPAADRRPEILQAFSHRVDFAERNLPTIISAAQAAADRAAADPTALVNVPYGAQPGFAEEIVNRAGGLANAFPPEERTKLMTANDVTLVSARSWEQDEAKVRQMVKDYVKPGSIVVLFASKAGMPADLKVDFLIDNGAADGKLGGAPMNAIANALDSWLWVSEYTAALTRHGKHPGILYSMVMPGATEHNAALQKSGEVRRTLFDTDKAIPAGEISAKYLVRVRKLEAQLAAPETLDSVNKAATVIATHIANGNNVDVSACTHILMSEVFLNRRTAMKPFHVVWQAKRAFPANVRSGDIVFWIGYIGVATVSEDYATPMRATGAKLVTSFVTDTAVPANNAPDALAHIEQHWKEPDSEVAVPFPPGVMAPVSGLDEAMIFRMVEDGVVRKLDAGY